MTRAEGRPSARRRAPPNHEKPGRPTNFGDEQKLRYRGRNVVERSFNKLKQWRGLATRSDKTVRSYRAAITLATTLIWIQTDLTHTS